MQKRQEKEDNFHLFGRFVLTHFISDGTGRETGAPWATGHTGLQVSLGHGTLWVMGHLESRGTFGHGTHWVTGQFGSRGTLGYGGILDHGTHWVTGHIGSWAT